jgi:hypothetical protein
MLSRCRSVGEILSSQLETVVRQRCDDKVVHALSDTDAKSSSDPTVVLTYAARLVNHLLLEDYATSPLPRRPPPPPPPQKIPHATDESRTSHDSAAQAKVISCLHRSG